ncbi:alpha/beta hydrolase [Candidatus Magnetomorum sp. HK-1]|nr:alpha/beta hydrolase [Candidatus Magnetomorum sp. HK-1]
MKSFTFNNNLIFYKNIGNGPPLIMLHNGGNDHRIWDYQINFFKNHFEIFAIDLLGYGLSDKPKKDYTLDLYTQMLEHFIHTNGFDQVYLMGHCVGSAISLSYALANPEKISHLVLMNIATIQTLSKGDLGKLHKWLQYSPFFRKSLSWLSSYLKLPRWAHALSIEQQYGVANEADHEFLDHLIQRYQDPRQFSVMLNLLLNFQSFERLDLVEKPEKFPPTFVIWGGQNKILPVTGGRIFAQNFKPDRFQIFPNGGHMVMRDCSSGINQSLFQFYNIKKRRTQ